MPGIEPALRTGLQDRHAHDAAGDGHVRGGKAGGVEHHEPLVATAFERAVRTRGHLREVGVLIRKDVARGGHALEQARVALPRKRNNLMADEVSQVAGIGVRGVLSPDDAAHAQQVAQLLVGAPQQRAHDSVAAAGDR